MIKHILSPLAIITATLLFAASCNTPYTEKQNYDMAVSALEDVSKTQHRFDSIARIRDNASWKTDSLTSLGTKRDIELKVVEIWINRLKDGNDKNALTVKYKDAVELAKYGSVVLPPPPQEQK